MRGCVLDVAVMGRAVGMIYWIIWSIGFVDWRRWMFVVLV